MMPFVTLWVVLAGTTAALAIYRRLLVNNEDTRIHLAVGEDALIGNQKAKASRLELIDRCGKVMTALAVASGVVLGAALLYIRFTTVD